MGDDVLEEISLPHLRVASVPTALHQSHPLATFRGILRRPVGPGHLDCAVIAPKTPHLARGRKRWMWLGVEVPDDSFSRGFWPHAGGLSELLPLSLPKWAKDVLRQSTPVVVVIVFSLGRGIGVLQVAREMAKKLGCWSALWSGCP